MTKKQLPLSKTDLDDIKQAVMLSELDTSGEIHVHIEEVCDGDAEERAKQLFEQLQLFKTTERNGILFYLAYKNRKFCIYPDSGIRKKVENDFWVLINQKLLNDIRNNRFADGLIDAVADTGMQLKKYFPRKPGDKNQLPDDVTFGEI